MIKRCVAVGAGLVAACRRSHSHAALRAVAAGALPGRPVKLVVPFTPGTGIDILARTLGQKMGDDWKVARRRREPPGASGNIGTEAVGEVAARRLHAAA